MVVKNCGWGYGWNLGFEELGLGLKLVLGELGFGLGRVGAREN